MKPTNELNTYRIILIPNSSFSSLPGSDTLFGAICWGIRNIYGEKELEETLSLINSEPKFVLSSCFPLININNNNKIYFYPKPIRADVTLSDIIALTENKDKKYKIEIISKLKKFKKAIFVSEKIFYDIVNGKSEKEVFKEYIDDKIILSNKILFKKDELNERQIKILEKVSLQKNMIDRFTFSTTPGGETFYTEELFFSKEVFLYFLIKTKDINYFLPIFRYLEDTGIGKDRFLGKGNFKFIYEQDQNNLFILPSNSLEPKFFLTLSKYIPKKDDIKVNGGMFYELVSYRSKVDSIFEFKGEDIFKDKIIYIKEGSIFETEKIMEYYGFCPIVKEIKGKKIYQNGLAFPIFIKIGKQ